MPGSSINLFQSRDVFPGKITHYSRDSKIFPGLLFALLWIREAALYAVLRLKRGKWVPRFSALEGGVQFGLGIYFVKEQHSPFSDKGYCTRITPGFQDGRQLKGNSINTGLRGIACEVGYLRVFWAFGGIGI